MSQSRPQRFSSTRKFIREYRRSRLGVAGIIIILFFLIIAFACSNLGSARSYQRPELGVEPLSIPSWAKMFPWYADTPVTSQLLSGSSLATQSDLSNWQILSRPSANDQSKGYVDFSNTQNGLLLQFKQPNGTAQVILSQLQCTLQSQSTKLSVILGVTRAVFKQHFK